MDTAHRWLAYFRRNAHRKEALAGEDVARLPAALRRALATSLGRFYLGEAGEGRITREVVESSDPAFGPVVAESIVLYIREEWRHARELRSILGRLDAVPAKRAWTETAFRRGRRSMGLRLKVLTIGAAEVAGIAYYSLLAERVEAPSLAKTAGRIADEERNHLAFVRALLERAATEHPIVAPAVDRLAVDATFAAVALCGAVAVAVDHRELIRMLSETEVGFLARCAPILRGSSRDCRAQRSTSNAVNSPVGVSSTTRTSSTRAPSGP